MLGISAESGRSNDTDTVQLVVLRINNVNKNTLKCMWNTHSYSVIGRDSILESFAALSGDAQESCIISLSHLPYVFWPLKQKKKESKFQCSARKHPGILSLNSSYTLPLHSLCYLCTSTSKSLNLLAQRVLIFWKSCWKKIRHFSGTVARIRK